ncbi:pre-mRNA splicing helicase BRR2 [Chloropicon primus]|nr:pre-mRNA splicing helicase BRR2 [Chloropicon primus]
MVQQQQEDPSSSPFGSSSKPRRPDYKQYSYAQNASLVLSSSSSRHRQAKEPTGEAVSLWGKLDPKGFGDRVGHAKPEKGKVVYEARGGKRKRGGGGASSSSRTGKASSSRTAAGVLGALDHHLDGCYRPRSAETRRAYETLLSIIREDYGDQPQDVIRFAADEILASLRAKGRTDEEKRKDVAAVLGQSEDQLLSAKFTQLNALSKLLHDFGEEDNNAGAGGDPGLDENIGVAVEFEESDGDGDQGMGEGDESETESTSDMGDMGDEDAGSGGDDDVRPRRRRDTAAPSSSASLEVASIDAYWLQRTLSKALTDLSPEEAHDKSSQVLAILEDKASSERDVENDLVPIFEYAHFEVVKLLLANRWQIVWCTKLARAQREEERAEIEGEMSSEPHLAEILSLLKASKTSGKDKESEMEKRVRAEARAIRGGDDGGGEGAEFPPAHGKQYKHVDLQDIMFQHGSRLMVNKSCQLPEGSYRSSTKDYEEVYVPPLKAKPFEEEEKLVKIQDLPEWSHLAFAGMTSLNRIQSRVCPCALYSSDNMLVCAPTGAGKTNVAVLTMLHEVGLHVRPDGSLDRGKFKIVYIAPMKALVAEMVGNFQKRFEKYGLKVSELTGDMGLTRYQLENTDIIVSTPEKWDIVTRKTRNRSFTQLVKLIIIDEVHLLHDDRGPVLESVVARTIQQVESTHEMTRLVGLSATLPNYQDVAMFLRVELDKGLFVFDNSFRPCPLEQHFVGVIVRKPLQRLQLMNQLCYDKVKGDAGKHQVLVFVHSRKETVKTARFLRDQAIADDTISKLVPETSASKEILNAEVSSCKNPDLAELLPYGIGVHHAGLGRSDRTLVEDLFSDGHLQVLVSTATLAWGVNLPAHTVVIKGTEVYNPTLARWDELSQLDVMQMLGRAGRPQFDQFGVGIIITSYNELQYYLSLFNQQLPIESQFVKQLADSLNAEIVSGMVKNVSDATTWLGYTYLFIRMLRNPILYSISVDELERDPLLQQHRGNLIHSAAILLEKHGLIKYDRRNGIFQGTDLGKIASTFYVSNTTMSTYNRYLKPNVGEMELCNIFCLSEEFKNIVVREEDKLELAKLLERVPIPVKENIEDPTAKVNVLLQAFISRLPLDGYVLSADTSFVVQNAGRLMRCIFEIILRHGWAQATYKALNMCKMISRRMWLNQTPLRQFEGIPADTLRRLEQKDIPWERYYDLTPQQLGEHVRNPKLGKALHKLVHHFPRLEIAAQLLPLTRSLIKIDLTLTPDFAWEDSSHGFVESFWIIVEDSDSEMILHSETFLLRKGMSNVEHSVSFTIMMTDPIPPQYFVRVISDKWLGSETSLPISFRHLILPQKCAPPTELLDLQPLPVNELRNKELEGIYKGVSAFNPIQTQVFPQLFRSSDNVIVCAPVGSGLDVCAEFAIFEAIARNGVDALKCVYIAPYEAVVKYQLEKWQEIIQSTLGARVMALSGETALDLKILQGSNVILSTPQNWDMISRRWRHRKSVQAVNLFIVDGIHLVASPIGPCIEVITSRMRYISKQTENPLRIVGLGSTIANARDISEWIGAKSHATFNFHYSARPVPLQVELLGFDSPFHESRLESMVRPAYHKIVQKGAKTMIFVPSWKVARMATVELLTFSAAQGKEKQFLNCAEEDLQEYLQLVDDKTLAHALSSGVAYLHEGLSQEVQAMIQQLFRVGAIQVVIATASLVWSLQINADLVILMGTEKFQHHISSASDYSLADVQQMIGKANSLVDTKPCTAVVMCQTSRKAQLLKFLQEPLPAESYLDHFLHDHICAETNVKMIENKQDAVDYVTWTLYYRRLNQNPNYYNLQGTSHRHISDHLSELIENVVSDLENAKCIAVEDDMDLFVLNLGMIATHYYLKYTTIELFSSSITAKTKLKGLLQILCNASEFDNVAVSAETEDFLRPLLRRIPIAVDERLYNLQSKKVNVLLQSQFSRLQVSPEHKAEQNDTVRKAIRLLHAMVDIVSSSGWLQPALEAMEFCQLLTQGLWTKDSWLMQLPHFTKELAAKCAGQEITGVFDVLDLDDAEREDLLGMDKKQLADVVDYAEAFPDIELNYEISAKEANCEEPVQIQVLLERKSTGNPHQVRSQAFPGQKSEVWWLCVGDTETNELLAIKRVNLLQKTKSLLEFSAPSVPGKHTLTLYFMCDSYLGADQEYTFDLATSSAAGPGPSSGDAMEE